MGVIFLSDMKSKWKAKRILPYRQIKKCNSHISMSIWRLTHETSSRMRENHPPVTKCADLTLMSTSLILHEW